MEIFYQYFFGFEIAKLHYGQQVIDYQIVRKANSLKLRIKFHPNQQVVITVPAAATVERS